MAATENVIDMDKYRNTHIDDTDLDNELANQSASFCFVAEMFVKARYEFEAYEGKRKELYGKLDEQVRLAHAGKKITETFVDKEVRKHRDYVAAKAHSAHLKARMGMAEALRDTWKMRQELLIEMCRNKRKEMDSLFGDTLKKTA